MLMFTFHIAFALGLMALTLGLFLKKCGCCKSQCDTSNANMQGKCGNGKCKSCCGMIIIILATLSLICTMYSGFCYWKVGAFAMPMAMEATSETIEMKVE